MISLSVSIQNRMWQASRQTRDDSNSRAYAQRCAVKNWTADSLCVKITCRSASRCSRGDAGVEMDELTDCLTTDQCARAEQRGCTSAVGPACSRCICLLPLDGQSDSLLVGANGSGDGIHHSSDRLAATSQPRRVDHDDAKTDIAIHSCVQTCCIRVAFRSVHRVVVL